MAALFKIGTKDYTRDIRVPGYTINRQASYTSWTDGNGLQHRDVARYQVGGSITLCFHTKTDYLDFIHTIRDAMQTDGFVTCQLYCNNTDEVRTVQAYVDLSPANLLPLVGSTSETIKVTIQER